MQCHGLRLQALWIAVQHVSGLTGSYPDSDVHGDSMGPTWVLSAPDEPHVGPMNLAIRVVMPYGVSILLPLLGLFLRFAKGILPIILKKMPALFILDVIFLPALCNIYNAQMENGIKQTHVKNKVAHKILKRRGIFSHANFPPELSLALVQVIIHSPPGHYLNQGWHVVSWNMANISEIRIRKQILFLDLTPDLICRTCYLHHAPSTTQHKALAMMKV